MSVTRVMLTWLISDGAVVRENLAKLRSGIGVACFFPVMGMSRTVSNDLMSSSRYCAPMK